MRRANAFLLITRICKGLRHLLALKIATAVRADQACDHDNLAPAGAILLTSFCLAPTVYDDFFDNTIGSGACTHILSMGLLDIKTEYCENNCHNTCKLFHALKNIFILIKI